MRIAVKEVPLETVWHIRKTVMYPERSLEEMILEDDRQGIHLGLFDGDRLCSVISLFRRGDTVQFRKFATVSALQGKGYGTRLLQSVFAEASKGGVRRVWCNARLSATAVYQKFGMRPYGETWEEQGHRFIKMEIEL